MKKTTLPVSSAERKAVPLYSGLLTYFPKALSEVARVSKLGNDKHNPGEPMHHARGKSSDHADCIIRHMVDMTEDYGAGKGRDENGVPQVAYICWRALALAQEWFEKHDGAPLAPGAEVEDLNAKAQKLIEQYPNPLPAHLATDAKPCHWCGAVGDEEHSCGGK